MVGIIDTSGSDNGDESVNQGATPKSGFYEGRRALTRLGFGPHAIGSRTVACKLMDRLGKVLKFFTGAEFASLDSMLIPIL